MRAGTSRFGAGVGDSRAASGAGMVMGTASTGTILIPEGSGGPLRTAERPTLTPSGAAGGRAPAPDDREGAECAGDGGVWRPRRPRRRSAPGCSVPTSCCSGEVPATPALLTRMSTLPKRSMVSATIACTAACSATSVGTASASRPSARISSATASISAAVRAASVTPAPFAGRRQRGCPADAAASAGDDGGLVLQSHALAPCHAE